MPMPIPNSARILLGLTLLAAPGQTQTGRFVERAASVGLIHEHSAGLDQIGNLGVMIDWAQSGIALGDIDGDGDLDVATCGGLAPNHLFFQEGGVFVDVSEKSGITANEFDRTPALGDYDCDGDLDLFLGSVDPGDGQSPGRSRLFRNEGSASFEDVTSLSGTTGHGHSLHARWSDLDLDGLLDLYVGEFHATANALYHNNGNGSFREIGAASGSANSGSAHVIATVDLDDDGFPDIVNANDYIVSMSLELSANSPDALLQGQPDGTFLDVSDYSGANNHATSMGIAFGDVNYDGALDMYKTEFGSNFLLLNRGWPDGAPWEEAALEFGVSNPEVPSPTAATGLGTSVGWGCAFLDLDLDPWLDLVVINGHVADADPRNQANFLFRGAGPSDDFAFDDVSEAWGFDVARDDRALAVGDIDQDGDVDLLVGALFGSLLYFENQLVDPETSHWVHVSAVHNTSAPGGMGTVVSWTDSLGYEHVRSLGADAPTASQNASETVFGLGDQTNVDVRVRFPSGITMLYPRTPASTRLVAEEPELLRLPFRTVAARRAGGAFDVLAFAHDSTGQPLDEFASVELDFAGLTAAGPTESIGGNMFRRSFLVPSTPGSYELSARFDDFSVMVKPRLHVTGPVNLDRSTLRPSPECVRAGSTDETAIEVVLRDASGTSVGADHDVAVLVEPDGFRVPLVALGDGRYRGAFRAPATPGPRQLRLELDNALVAPRGRLEVAGAPSPVKTDFYGEPPRPLIASQPDRFNFIVTPKDSFGLRVGPNASASVELIPNAGTAPVKLIELHSQADGEYWGSMLRTTSDTALGFIRVTIDGVLVAEEPYAIDAIPDDR